jgi:hypothetical protein
VSSLSLRHIDGWTLADGGFGDPQPRVRDLELAEHLGFERLHNIRKLIARMAENGRLGIVSTVEIIHQGAGRPGTEYWLTEAQALKVVAKSETARADAILDEVIRVFIAVRGVAPAPTAELADLRAAFARLEAQNAQLVTEVRALASGGTSIHPAVLTDIRRQVRAIADAWVAARETKSLRSAQRRIYNRLTLELAWGGPGQPWTAFPAHRVCDLRNHVAAIAKETEARRPNPQLTLFKGGK